MSKSDFKILLQNVAPVNEEKRYFCATIPATVRLAVSLRHISAGDLFVSLMYISKISK